MEDFKNIQTWLQNLVDITGPKKLVEALECTIGLASNTLSNIIVYGPTTPWSKSK